MIKTVNDLIAYVAEDAEDYLEISRKNRFLIKPISLPPIKLKELEANLGILPDSFKKIIQHYEFNPVDVGYFSLSPRSYQADNIIDALIKANLDDPFLPKDFLNKNGLIWIGSNNDYTVYLAQKSSPFKEGEIILIDEEILRNIDQPRDCDIQRLAPDFEHFLIAAGNLNQIHREIEDDESNLEEKKAEFINRLKITGINEEYHPAWMSVF